MKQNTMYLYMLVHDIIYAKKKYEKLSKTYTFLSTCETGSEVGQILKSHFKDKKFTLLITLPKALIEKTITITRKKNRKYSRMAHCKKQPNFCT